MTDQFTSLSPSVLHQIIGHLDESIRLLDSADRHTVAEIKIKSMLVVLRRQLREHLAIRLGTNA